MVTLKCDGKWKKHPLFKMSKMPMSETDTLLMLHCIFRHSCIASHLASDPPGSQCYKVQETHIGVATNVIWICNFNLYKL